MQEQYREDISVATSDPPTHLSSVDISTTRESSPSFFNRSITDKNLGSSSQSIGNLNDMSFFQKLMDILNDNQFSDIIQWLLPSDVTFTIIDRKRFDAEILPQYFNN